MDTLYQEDLMDLYKHPLHKGHIDDADAESNQKNSMCGDEIILQLKIDDGKIADAKFDGTACAVSIISSSLITDFIIGKTLEEAKQIDKDKLLEMIGLNLTTSRVKCATLVLNALQNALEGLE